MTLTKEDEDRLKNLMLDFILRVSNGEKSPEEVAILPEIIKILLLSFKKEEHDMDNCKWSVTPLISPEGDMSPIAKALIKAILE